MWQVEVCEVAGRCVRWEVCDVHVGDGDMEGCVDGGV